MRVAKTKSGEKRQQQRDEKHMRMYRPWVMLLGLVLVGYAAWAEPAETAPIQTWAQMLDAAVKDTSTEDARAALIAQARETAALEVLRRAHTLGEVGTHRTWLDGRANALEPEIKEQFALAMSDHGACGALSKELPLLAAAYRLTGDAAFLERTLAQLEEMATWSPLQRPGWTLYSPGNRLPADGKDGNWLATGTGVRALGDTLELLPPEAVPAELRAKVDTLLEAEIAGVMDDWATQRPWFVRSNNPITNQWVLPTEGLVRACLILGQDTHREAYDLGVKNLLMALDAHGAHGEFEEGFGYASFTVTAMLHAAHAMAAAGDRRAVDHPFLAHFPTWLVHHFQPGKMIVNCFDAGGAYDAANGARPLLSLLAVCTGSSVARWALANQTSGPSEDLAGLGARALPPAGQEAAPPLFAQYERAARVNWRSSWSEDASGVWIRGGHPADQHDHQDRGHVNFVAKGKPILIEAGTPAYHHKLMMTHYTTGAGHNVLQLGTRFPDQPANAGDLFWLPGWQKARGTAPITVRRLEDTGGEAMVDGTACYDGIEQWQRHVLWDSTQITVKDCVKLSADQKDVVLFRWHLGTEAEADIRGENQRYAVSWPDAEMTLDADAPIAVAQVKLPDNTLAGHTSGEEPGNIHTCVVVQSSQPVQGFTMTARVTVK